MKPVVNAFYVREYTVGAAMPLPVYLKHWDFRGGVRIKYLQGIAGAYTNKAHMSMYTEDDGRYITAAWDYKVNAAYMENFSPFRGTGRGLGTDLGITAHYNTRWYGNVNLLDLGFVRFRTSAHSYEDEEEYTFEGIVVDNIFSDDLSIDTDEIEDLIVAEDNTGTPFTMPYPLRFRSHFAYRIPATSPEGDLYHKHSFSATYIQGMYDLGNATRIPYFAVAYDFSFRDHFEAGTNFGFSGFNRMELGAFAAFRVGAFRFGAGSGNFTALLFPKYGSGADLSMNMTASF
jgi:hypothetical protein